MKGKEKGNKIFETAYFDKPLKNMDTGTAAASRVFFY